MEPDKIIVDVWDGHNSMNHVARFVQDMKQSLLTAEKELNNGYLVNLRRAYNWRDYKEFDNRPKVH